MATTTTRSRNPRGQGDRLRSALLDATRDLLLELGDQDKLSVRLITARAGVSANALYLHFANKDELLSAVMTTCYTELRGHLQAAVATETDPFDQLRALGIAYLDFATERPGIYRVLFLTRVREGVPMPAPGAEPGMDEGVDTFNDLLAIVSRCLPDAPDAFIQAGYLWAGLHGFVSLAYAMPAFPWPPGDEYVDRMIDIHVRNHNAQPGP